MMKLVVGLVSAYKVTTAAVSKLALAAQYKTRLKYTYIAGIFVQVYTRIFTDSTAITDVSILDVNKSASDVISATDVLNSRVMQKAVTETLTATDNLDGSATAEDEQTAQLFKATTDSASITDTEASLLQKPLADSGSLTDTEVTLVSKPAADAASVTDTETSAIAKLLADSGNIVDTGLISLPNYADPAYFSEQYVVDYRTF